MTPSPAWTSGSQPCCCASRNPSRGTGRGTETSSEAQCPCGMPPSPCSFRVRASDHCGMPIQRLHFVAHEPDDVCVCVFKPPRVSPCCGRVGRSYAYCESVMGCLPLVRVPSFPRTAPESSSLVFQYVQSLCFILPRFYVPFPGLGTQPSCCNRCFACSL